MIYLCNIKYFHSIVLQLLAMSSFTFSFLYTLRDFTITCHLSGLHVASRPAVLTLASTTLCLEWCCEPPASAGPGWYSQKWSHFLAFHCCQCPFHVCHGQLCSHSVSQWLEMYVTLYNPSGPLECGGPPCPTWSRPWCCPVLGCHQGRKRSWSLPCVSAPVVVLSVFVTRLDEYKKEISFVAKPVSGDVGAHDHVTVLHLGLFLNFQEPELDEVSLFVLFTLYHYVFK